MALVSMERTLVIVKPDGVQRGLVGEIIGRLERRGLKIAAIRVQTVGRDVAERHYGEHKGKPFFAGLIDYITSGPVVTAVLEGPNAVEATRSTMGATNPTKAAPGPIRGDLGLIMGRNLIHGSDSVESADREIGIFFGDVEIPSFALTSDRWIVEE
jgi:nucleoside-diphosphate kinase